MKAVCYSATQKRTVQTYITLFKALKDAALAVGIQLSPLSHMIDFEKAAATASKNIFGGTSVTFCHFHFAKAIWRGIKKKNLVSVARQKNCKKLIADLIALPMIPITFVNQRFDIISKELHFENKLFDGFVDYFRRTYIKSKQFPIRAWNHYSHLGTLPRTNNHVEGSHRQLKNRILSKPNIWSWIMAMQDLDESTTIAIEQEEHQNRQTRPRKRRNIRRDEDLLNLKEEYEQKRIDFETFYSRLRHTSYSYMTTFDNLMESDS